MPKNKPNVNKNNVEYILRLHLGTSRDITPGDIIMSPLVTAKRWTYDNAQCHVTAFRPISNAARSWSYDTQPCLPWASPSSIVKQSNGQNSKITQVTWQCRKYLIVAIKWLEWFHIENISIHCKQCHWWLTKNPWSKCCQRKAVFFNTKHLQSWTYSNGFTQAAYLKHIQTDDLLLWLLSGIRREASAVGANEQEAYWTQQSQNSWGSINSFQVLKTGIQILGCSYK